MRSVKLLTSEFDTKFRAHNRHLYELCLQALQQGAFNCRRRRRLRSKETICN